MVISILIGILGLGIVIFFHELGHFLAAKAAGVTVEVFSIGWGKRLWGFTFRGTEYRLSLFPIGGYCRMKGEAELKEALEQDLPKLNAEKGSLFSVPRWKRILVYLAGPFANFLFSILVLGIIWFSGFTTQTYENRIVLLSEYLPSPEPRPADGVLITGDRILAVDGKMVDHYRDIQEFIAPNPGKTLVLTVERSGAQLNLPIVPKLNPDSGAGLIGVAAWVEPVIMMIAPDSPAFLAGLMEGDRITKAKDTQIANHVDFLKVLSTHPRTVDLEILRDGITREITVLPDYSKDDQGYIGIVFQTITYNSEKVGIFGAFIKGIEESFETLVLTLKGISLLFRGVNVGKAVAGPIRMTYYVGEVASRSFQMGFGVGLINLFRFLSLISVALCFVNLLPIPALDGGMILINTVEIARGGALRPKTYYRYQLVGFFVILVLLFFTTFSDLFFLIQK